MLRWLAVLAMLAGGAAMLEPNIGTNTLGEAFRHSGQVVRDLLGTKGGVIDGKAPQQQAPYPTQGESPQPEKKTEAHIQPTHPKAFYNNPPEECYWEKIIEPEDGSVRCSVPDRRQVARQR